MQRPTGVTILAVLAAIGGIFGLYWGFLLLTGGTVGVAGLTPVDGLVTIVVSAVQLAIAYGFWTLKPWAWQWGIVLMLVNVLIAILGVVGVVFARDITSALISVLISAVIIYYLNRPEIRAAFGAPATGWPFIGGA